MKTTDYTSPHRKLRGGGYQAVHKWLTKHFGKADMCTDNKCNGESKIFQWCLKKGFKYEHKRENFIKMCQTCHRSYDRSPEWDKSLSLSKTGIKNPRAIFTEKMVIDILLEKHEMRLIDISKKYGKSIEAIYKILKGENWKHIRADIKRRKFNNGITRYVSVGKIKYTSNEFCEKFDVSKHCLSNAFARKWGNSKIISKYLKHGKQ